MRIFAFILSILVLQLSVQPCCLDSGKTNSQNEVSISAPDKCCSNEGSNSTSDLPTKTCSPFFGCCASAGFVFSNNASLQEVNIFLTKEVSLPAYKDLYHFELVSSILQPPQIIS